MKIGIEIHQRIDSHKLFCNCPSIANESDPDKKLIRRLHTVYSELGEVDVASKREFEKDKTFEYWAYENCNCLVETDEEPPHLLNRHALGIALEIALHLNCKPVDEIHVMRKIIIDGSNTSGFQRTAVIALNGKLETPKGPVGIPQISIEEESAGIIENTDGKSVFRLDRLGIPLIEITTDPDIKDGEHLLEVAEKIGMIMRATGKVARGLGTIRQDLNVSTEGGARVEIKGAQDLKLLTTLAQEEVRRQKELIEIAKQIKAGFGGKQKIEIKRTFVDLTEVFKNTESKLIKVGVSAGGAVFGLKLEHHAGIIGKEIQPNRRYGTELSDYAKGAGVKGILHSDEKMDRYQISDSEAEGVRKKLAVNDDDAFVLVVSEPNKAKKALENVCYRAEMLEIPNETRKANPDGTTSYMRPLPGRARLYPETDIPAIRVDKELLKSVEKSESLDDKKAKLLKILNPEMAERILKSKNLAIFEKLTPQFGKVEPMLIANTLENTIVSIRREGFNIDNLEEVMIELFAEYEKESFVKSAIPDILKLAAKGANIRDAVKQGKFERIKGAELEKIARENDFEVAKIMQKYRLNVEPADLAKIKKK